MFTGIVRHCGQVHKRHGDRLALYAPALVDQLAPGDSAAVNGACLTAVELDTAEGTLAVDLSPETRRRTTLGALEAGEAVNLELPLAPSDRLGGHFVQGHVDAVGEVTAIEILDDHWEFTFAVDSQHDALLIEKGSVAVDGISLTCYDVSQGRFRVAVIPHTLRETTLQGLSPRDRVNVEFDMLGKYVQKQLRTTDLRVNPASPRG
ncbi:MAG: riboflavin synthase [Candidatus Bipolaricaulia bacterium]